MESICTYQKGGFHPVVLRNIINNRYVLVHKLGNGGFATVWMVEDMVKKEFVTLNIICANYSEDRRELQILQYLKRRAPDMAVSLEENFICPSWTPLRSFSGGTTL